MSWEQRGYASGGGFGGGGGRFSDNPLTWSPTIGRVAGIRVRIHIVFILFILFRILSAGDYFAYAAHSLFILFGSVFLHELGHCFAARRMGGRADEILMWPLGGLAFVDVPRRPWPEFVTVICGPLVNVALLAACGLLLRLDVAGSPFAFFNPISGSWGDGHAWLSITYEVNMLLFLFNLWPMYPMDGGRMLQCVLWWRLDLVRATAITTTVGMVAAIVMGVYGLVTSEYLLLAIAVIGYIACYQQRQQLKAGGIQADGFMGYDFSGGYSTLEPGRRRPGPLARWRQRRAQARHGRAEEDRQRQETEVDRILQKVHAEGMNSLTRSEKRTLESASKGRG